MFEDALRLISRGTVELIEKNELIEKLKKGRPLVVKAGFDPTAPDLHLGHTVLLRKLRHFQELGHHVKFLIGDFTGMIGDPTGKSKTRKQLTEEEVKINAETYKRQISKILDMNKMEIVYNSSWLGKMSLKDAVELTAKYTVARILERDDFMKRYKSGADISVHEFLYPFLQGFDSVVMKADVELGGTDQKFNLLMGRVLQKRFGQDEQQIVITMPLLEGLDGKDKMSKSLGNYVSINDTPTDMLGKLMTVPDALILKYFELLTDVPENELVEMRKSLEQGENPRHLKMRLAKTIVTQYYSPEDAAKEEELFDKKFKSKDISLADLPLAGEVAWDSALHAVSTLFTLAGDARSNTEIRKLLKEGSIACDEKPVDLAFMAPPGEHIFKLGKKRVLKVKIV